MVCNECKHCTGRISKLFTPAAVAFEAIKYFIKNRCEVTKRNLRKRSLIISNFNSYPFL